MYYIYIYHPDFPNTFETKGVSRTPFVCYEPVLFWQVVHCVVCSVFFASFEWMPLFRPGRAEVMFKGQSKKILSRLARQIHFLFHERIKSGCPKVRKTAAKTSETFILYLNSNPNHSQTMSNPLQQNPSTYENVITSRRGPCFFDPPPCFFDPPLFFWPPVFLTP